MLKIIYYALINSHDIVILYMAQIQIKILISIYITKKAIRILVGLKSRDSVGGYFKQLGKFTVYSLYVFGTVKHIRYKS